MQPRPWGRTDGTRRRILGVCLGILLVGGCATNEPLLTEGDADALPTPKEAFEDPDYDIFKEYRITTFDELELLFQFPQWERQDPFTVRVDQTIAVRYVTAPELDVVQPVRPDGFLSLPYLGDYRVLGKTVPQIHRELRKAYTGILLEPEIYVVVQDYGAAIRDLKDDLRTDDLGLGRLIVVQPDGGASFPLVGRMAVAGKSLKEVQSALNDAYGRYAEGLRADLSLNEHAGSKVYVLGQVNNPGAFEIERPVSVLQALALAEGHRYGARLDSVVIARRQGGDTVAARVNLLTGSEFGGPGKTLWLQPDDIVFVPRTWVASAAEVARDIASVLMFRGWGITIGTADVKF
jgi:polysaccharide export outer membrane protein